MGTSDSCRLRSHLFLFLFRNFTTIELLKAFLHYSSFPFPRMRRSIQRQSLVHNEGNTFFVKSYYSVGSVVIPGNISKNTKIDWSPVPLDNHDTVAFIRFQIT